MSPFSTRPSLLARAVEWLDDAMETDPAAFVVTLAVAIAGVIVCFLVAAAVIPV